MALTVKDGGFCSGDTCYAGVGSSFTLTVDVVTAPAAGYILMQTYIDYGVFDAAASEDGAGPNTCSDGIDNGYDGPEDRLDADCATADLIYKPAADLLEEFVWPDVGADIALQDEPGPGLVGHGGLTGLMIPLVPSTYEGTVIEIQMSCPATPVQASIDLLPYGDPVAVGYGSAFVEPDPFTQVVPKVASITLNCVSKQAEPGDTDGEGCSDQRENGPDETLGGLRDYLNPWDFYDTNGDRYIDLANDILGVYSRYGLREGDPGYDPAYDRGASTGPNPWNMTAPDGVIDLPNDIMGVQAQYQHDCR